jgi:hypothetical protein
LPFVVIPPLWVISTIINATALTYSPTYAQMYHCIVFLAVCKILLNSIHKYCLIIVILVNCVFCLGFVNIIVRRQNLWSVPRYVFVINIKYERLLPIWRIHMYVRGILTIEKDRYLVYLGWFCVHTSLAQVSNPVRCEKESPVSQLTLNWFPVVLDWFQCFQLPVDPLESQKLTDRHFSANITLSRTLPMVGYRVVDHWKRCSTGG